jgi:hypothetical protein
MIKCRTCLQTKDDSEFNFKIKKIGKRQSKCKPCTKEYRKTYYNGNRADALKYAAASSAKARLRNQQFINEYLLNKSCVDCGYSDSRALEFDHVRGKKNQPVTTMISGWGIESIKKEISKCDVRCANCHRIRTVESRNQYRSIK